VQVNTSLLIKQAKREKTQHFQMMMMMITTTLTKHLRRERQKKQEFGGRKGSFHSFTFNMCQLIKDKVA